MQSGASEYSDAPEETANLNLNFHRALFLMRLQRRAPNFVALNRFFRANHAEFFAEYSGSLGSKTRQHLQNAIGKTGFKNPAGDGSERHLVAQVNVVPRLLFAVFKNAERFGFFG